MVFTSPEAPSSVLKANPLPLGSRRVFLLPFSLGFDPVLEDSRVTSLFIRFLGLPYVYLRLLAAIGASFGVVKEIPPILGLPSSAAEAISSDGVSRVRVLVSDPNIADDHIMPQRPNGSFFRQRVEITRWQDQCGICRCFGHFARDCPKKTKRPKASGQALAPISRPGAPLVARPVHRWVPIRVAPPLHAHQEGPQPSSSNNPAGLGNPGVSGAAVV